MDISLGQNTIYFLKIAGTICHGMAIAQVSKQCSYWWTFNCFQTMLQACTAAIVSLD